MQALSEAVTPRAAIGELIVVQGERKKQLKSVHTCACPDNSRSYVQAVSRELGDPSRLDLDELLNQHKKLFGVEWLSKTVGDEQKLLRQRINSRVKQHGRLIEQDAPYYPSVGTI